MKEEAQATPKSIGKADIKAAAEKDGMCLSDFIEWGMHMVMDVYSHNGSSPGDAKDELTRLRGTMGGIAPGVIRQSPAEAFIESEGMSKEEFAEFAILTLMDLEKEGGNWNRKPIEMLGDYRDDKRLLLPEIGNGSGLIGVAAQTVSPFMHRLFSGDLRAIHGPTFGDPGSAAIGREHHFLAENLDELLDEKVSMDNSMSRLACVESVIRHCPELKNEANAIRTMHEAFEVLCGFVDAVEHC